jgi:DNA-binding transcriptional ArsR family regulator
MSRWQDESVNVPQPSEAQPLAVRTVSEVGGLRAMADPTRLAILSALMQSRQGELPVMSAKELAAQLGESQTKLYRHINQLEAAGLIRVAAIRMVSGILEHRYQACQRDLAFAGGFLRQHADESEAVMEAMLTKFRDGFVTAFRDSRLAPDVVPESDAYRKPKLYVAESRVSPTVAADIRSSLEDLMKRLSDKDMDDPDGVVLVNMLVGYFTEVDDQDGGRPSHERDMRASESD